MKINDLIYVAGAVRPINQIQSSNARFEAGFLVSKKNPHSQYEQSLLDAGLFKKLPIYDLATNRQSLHDKELQLSTAHFKKLNKHSEHVREAARASAESIGSSKGAKVRHKINAERYNKISRTLLTLAAPIGVKTILSDTGAFDNHLATYDSTERNTARILSQRWEKQCPFNEKLAPSMLHIQCRDWSGQYRAMVVANTPPSAAPAANAGERFTEQLTKRSVSKIFESGAYVAQCKDGFKTFLTLTFSRKQRLALFGGMAETEEGNLYTPIEFVRDEGKVIPGKDGLYTELPAKPFQIIKVLETTMGAEVSRFLDAIKKMYQRGWARENGESVTPAFKAVGSEFGPSRELPDFDYLWVAECPMNDDGEPNPHIHMLMNWEVTPDIFRDWAVRLESLWGHGMANLQRIHHSKGASKYLIKAIGYAAKGENAGQGLIRGNRYNIARCSRAPAWETLATFDTDNMTAIIKELGYKLEHWKKPLARSMRRIQAQKEQAIKAAALPVNQDADKQMKLQQLIIRKERAMKKLSEEMKSREMHASSRKSFSVTFDGDNAKSRLDELLLWAAGARGWSMNLTGMSFDEAQPNGERVPVFKKPDDFFVGIGDLKKHADEKYAKEYQQFQDKRAYWKSVLESPPYLEEVDEEEANRMLSMIHAHLGSRYTVRQRRETETVH